MKVDGPQFIFVGSMGTGLLARGERHYFNGYYLLERPPKLKWNIHGKLGQHQVWELGVLTNGSHTNTL